jgi:hypothetical protein
LANAQTAFAMSREGMSESDKTAARRVSARATPEKRSLRPASSPALALACAQATFASARASKASRAHIAVETRASASNRASSKKSRLANAQLDACDVARAESRGGVVLREGVLRDSRYARRRLRR